MTEPPNYGKSPPMTKRDMRDLEKLFRAQRSKQSIGAHSAAYTPGPWTACFSILSGEPYDFHVAAGPHGSSLPVCELRQSIEVLSPHGHDLPYWPPNTLEANARLIAAAPNLFEAADKALHAIDNILTSHEGQSEHAELKAAYFALEAALNKAEGLPA